MTPVGCGLWPSVGQVWGGVGWQAGGVVQPLAKVQICVLEFRVRIMLACNRPQSTPSLCLQARRQRISRARGLSLA